jgi:Outer membrane protein beta-barrel domain
LVLVTNDEYFRNHHLAPALILHYKPMFMKNIKTILLLTGFCLFAIIALAQPVPGLKAGVNYSGIKGYEGAHRLSFHAGIMVQSPINKNWSIQPELLYSGEGQHYTYTTGDGEEIVEHKGVITMSYVALPVMLRYYPDQEFYFEAGPQFSVLVAAHSKGVGNDEMNMKRSFANTQFALGLGAGVYFTPRVGIYARYQFGLTDLTPFDEATDRSQVGQVGVMVNLKK